jgi:flagellar hook-length control protein FliK
MGAAVIQTNLLISMLGVQPQTKTALTNLQGASGFASPAVSPMDTNQHILDASTDPNGSLFQLMLSYMLPGATSQPSAPGLQEPAQGGGTSKPSAKGSIALPFPSLETEPVATDQNASISAMMPFSPFMFTPMPQLQEPASAAPASETAASDAAAAVVPAASAFAAFAAPAPAAAVLPSDLMKASGAAQAVINAAAIPVTNVIPAPQQRSGNTLVPGSSGADANTALLTVPQVEAAVASTDAPAAVTANLIEQSSRAASTTANPAPATSNPAPATANPVPATANLAPSIVGPVASPAKETAQVVQTPAASIVSAPKFDIPAVPAQNEIPVAQKAISVTLKEISVSAQQPVEVKPASPETPITGMPVQERTAIALPEEQDAQPVEQNDPATVVPAFPAQVRPATVVSDTHAVDQPAKKASIPVETPVTAVASETPGVSQAAGEKTGIPAPKIDQISRVTASFNTPQRTIDAASTEQTPSVAETVQPRTPETFMLLHDVIAQASEPILPKNSAKPASVQPVGASVRPAESQSQGAATVQSSENVITQAAQATDPVRVHADASATNVQTVAASNAIAHDAATSAAQSQRPENSAADIHAVKPEMSLQHPEMLANSIQTSGAMSAHESAQSIAPHVKEDVFERVFKEVSSIRHTPASVNVTLSPESLGKVTVNVGLEDGKMAARINVQNTDVKQILDAAMPKLQEALQANGLTMDSIAVFVNNSSSFADRRNDAPKKKMSTGQSSNDDRFEALGSVGDSRQYGYSTVEYIM